MSRSGFNILRWWSVMFSAFCDHRHITALYGVDGV